MDATSSGLSLLLALLLLTTFVKTATVLSIARYGLGLVGFEFGAVCLVVALGMAWLACPPELTALGFPDALFSRNQTVQPQAVSQALVPYMERRIDPAISKHFTIVESKSSAGDSSVEQGQSVSSTDAQVVVRGESASLHKILPAYLLSELKGAFQLGCLILIPLVIVDLLVAHVLALIGVSNLSTATVALPLKLILFLVAGGWGLLGRKFIGIE
ncbi:MAG: hypothetical protein ACK5GN_12755 [Pseudomonadota bacterium]|jgi:flagellar biosynthesis protein FliP